MPGAVNPADPTAPFELDGNALAQEGPPPQDWNCVPFSNFSSPPTTANCHPPNPEASAYVPDPVESNTDDILGQGSKDILDLDEWTRVLKKPPAKDDIANAAWATYSVPVSGQPDHEIVYFTADRISNNGDAFMGFWFFKNRLEVSGSSISPNHAVGDVLVLVNFIQGSGQKADSQEIGVFRWVGTGGDVQGGTLETIIPIGDGDCATAASTVHACAQFNTEPVPSNFPFQSTNSGDPANEYAVSQFVEGGIDLTQLLQGDDCFSSVMAESRSSSSVTAEQKDIVIGSLNTCGTIKIVKDSIPDSTQPFGFQQDAADVNDLDPASFSLFDDGNVANNTQTYELVKPGQYKISELANPTDWTLTNISC